MNTSTYEKLSRKWRTEAEVIARRGVFGDVGSLLKSVADELDGAIEAHDDELLTLDEAVEESGYTRRKIERDLETGRIPNSGKPRQPRVRRGDLPYKPPRTRPKSKGRTIAGKINSARWQAEMGGAK